ncbi:MAG: hypothetical protein WDN27_03505 [Candidatus Saccharibacteria bacterium]
MILKIGEQEAEKQTITAKARFSGEEREFNQTTLIEDIQGWLEELQAAMLQASRDHLAANTREAKSYDEFKQLLKEHKGFIKVWWNDNKEIEEKIQTETKATSRCQPLDWVDGQGTDFYTGEPATKQWVFAQSY